MVVINADFKYSTMIQTFSEVEVEVNVELVQYRPKPTLHTKFAVSANDIFDNQIGKGPLK